MAEDVPGMWILSAFHRCIGYSFFSWTKRDQQRVVNCKTKSPYLVYAVCAWLLYQFVMAQDVYCVLYAAYPCRPLRNIDKTVLFFYFTRCIGVQLANAATMFLHSRKTLKVISTTCQAEGTSVSAKRLRKSAIMIVIFNALFSLSTIIAIMGDIERFQGYMSPLYMKIGYGMFSFVFVETSCMVCFSWVMYCAKFFQDFLRQRNEDIESLLTASSVDPKHIEDLHRKQCYLYENFQQCSDIFRVSLLVGVPLCVMNIAPWGYYLIIAGDNTERLRDAIGFASMLAELLVLGLYARSADSEAKKTWQVLTKLLVSHDHPPEVRHQIEQFRHTCQNQDFSFSGCGFFTVGPPLIVSIASAIITYTVILYQSDSTASAALSSAHSHLGNGTET